MLQLYYISLNAQRENKKKHLDIKKTNVKTGDSDRSLEQTWWAALCRAEAQHVTAVKGRPINTADAVFLTWQTERKRQGTGVLSSSPRRVV